MEVRRVCREHQVPDCEPCQRNQCLQMAAFQCILPQGHSPFSRDQLHCFGGMSPRSVWLPTWKAIEILRTLESLPAPEPRKTVYISIGNSDDKLPQAKWSLFIKDMHRKVAWLKDEDVVVAVHGVWFSSPEQPWQNANWCVEVYQHGLDTVRAELAEAAWLWGQDSIAMTVGTVEFIRAKEPS